MSDSFDPYYVWLGIPPEEQPADHYRLLGLRQFEENRDVISHAAEQRMAHLKSMQAGPRSQHTQVLLNQLAAARACLMVPEQKSAYDAQLRQTSAVEPQRTYVPPLTVDEPPLQSSFEPHVADRTVLALMLMLGMAAVLSMIAVGALVLVWNSPGRESAEAKPNVEQSPISEADRELPPIGQLDPSTEPRLPKPVEPTSVPPLAKPRSDEPASDRAGPVEAPVAPQPKRDYAVRLGSVGDAIVLENTIDLFTIGRYFTVELWARFHATPDPRSIVGNQVSQEDGSSAGWLLHIPIPTSRGTRDNTRYITLNGVFRCGGQLPEKKSEWQHVAICGDRTSLLVFIDGALVLRAEDDAAFWPASDSNLMIGRNPRNQNYRRMGQNRLPTNIGDFRGDIRALRISSACLYRENFVPPPVFAQRADDLVLLDFTLGDGDTLPDLSGNGHDGQIVSGEWLALPDSGFVSATDAAPPSGGEVAGTTRDFSARSYRSYNGPEADAYADVFEQQGYRRFQDQVINVDRPVFAPTVFLAQRLELFDDARANVAIVAQRVDVHGIVEGNLDIWAQSLYLKPTAIIKGNLRVKFAQSIEIEGRVEGIISGNYGRIRIVE